MKKSLTFCDVCGKEIVAGYGPDKGNLLLVGRASKKKTNVQRLVLDDLCHDCTAELFTMVNKYLRGKKNEKNS